MKILFAIISLWFALITLTHGQESLIVTQADGTETEVTTIKSEGKWLLIWHPSVYAELERHFPMAEQLASAGIEVWLPEFLEGRFLPVTSSSMDELPAEDLQSVIQAAIKTGKRVAFMTGDRAAVPAFRVAPLLQDEFKSGLFTGFLMFTPSLYTHIPQPGQKPLYLPELDTVPVPLYLMQPTYSPGYFYAEDNLAYLRSKNIKVEMETIPGMRDGFWMRRETRPQEIERAKTFHLDIKRALHKLGAMQ